MLVLLESTCEFHFLFSKKIIGMLKFLIIISIIWIFFSEAKFSMFNVCILNFQQSNVQALTKVIFIIHFILIWMNIFFINFFIFIIEFINYNEKLKSMPSLDINFLYFWFILYQITTSIWDIIASICALSFADSRRAVSKARMWGNYSHAYFFFVLLVLDS